MYKSTELAALPPRKPTYLSTVHSMWRLLLVTFWYWILQWGNSDLTGAFLRSRVTCPEVVPVGGVCPEGTLYRDGQCLAQLPGSASWSGSQHCAHKAHVIAHATAIGGRMSSCGTIAGIVAQVVIGTTLVDSIGRKPVMVLGVLSSCICAGLFFASCFCPCHTAESLMFTAVIASGLINSFPVASLAMASDLAQGSTEQQGMGYSALNVIRHAGILIAFAAGFFILKRDLSDYTVVWGVFLALSLFVLSLTVSSLRETLSRKEANAEQALCADEGGGPNRAAWEARTVEAGTARPLQPGPFAEMASALRLVWNDHFLRWIMLSIFFGDMAALGAVSITGSYALSVVRLDQAVASLAGVVQPAAIMFASAASAELIRRYGPFYTLWLGKALVIVGLFLTGMAAPANGVANVLFWLGWGFITGCGFGIVCVSGLAIISSRADNSAHGKLFAAQGFVSSIGITIGQFVWSNILFDATATSGWHGGLAYFVSAIIEVCLISYTIMLYRIYIIPERCSQDAAEHAAAVRT